MKNYKRRYIRAKLQDTGPRAQAILGRKSGSSAGGTDLNCLPVRQCQLPMCLNLIIFGSVAPMSGPGRSKQAWT